MQFFTVTPVPDVRIPIEEGPMKVPGPEMVCPAQFRVIPSLSMNSPLALQTRSFVRVTDVVMGSSQPVIAKTGLTGKVANENATSKAAIRDTRKLGVITGRAPPSTTAAAAELAYIFFIC